MKHRMLLMGVALGLIASAYVLANQRKGRRGAVRQQQQQQSASRHWAFRWCEVSSPVNHGIDTSITSSQLPM